jgi:hypothetical protein
VRSLFRLAAVALSCDHLVAGLLGGFSVLDCLGCGTSSDGGAALGTLALAQPVAREKAADARFTRARHATSTTRCVPSPAFAPERRLLVGNEAELLEHAEVVVALPLLHDPPVLDAVQAEPLDLHPPAGGRPELLGLAVVGAS